MTPQLKDLLFLIRQHDAFQELLKAIPAPQPKDYRPSEDPQKQWAEFIFRSGQQRQAQAWQSFLTESAPEAGSITSQKEQS